MLFEREESYIEEEEMAVKIRLARGGRTHKAFFRVVIADEREARDGRYIEVVGTYDPHIQDDKEAFKPKQDRIQYWLDKGAQPTLRVTQLMNKVAAASS